MTTNPPPGEPSPWSNPTSGYPDPNAGYPDPTSGYPNPTSGYPTPTSGYPSPTSGYPQPGYPQAGYPQAGYPQAGYPPAGYPQAGYPQADGWGVPAAPYPVYPQRKQNGLALAAMIVSICAFVLCGGVFGIVGALMGHAARKQIRETGEDGEGLATAGIIIGWIGFGIGVVIVLVYVGIFAIAIGTDYSGTT